MLRYKTETRPGLVALYDIRPRNGAGQFLQPRSPHGAAPKGDVADPLEMFLSTCFYHAEFDHSGSNRLSIIMEIC